MINPIPSFKQPIKLVERCFFSSRLKIGNDVKIKVHEGTVGAFLNLIGLAQKVSYQDKTKTKYYYVNLNSLKKQHFSIEMGDKLFVYSKFSKLANAFFKIPNKLDVDKAAADKAAADKAAVDKATIDKAAADKAAADKAAADKAAVDKATIDKAAADKAAADKAAADKAAADKAAVDKAAIDKAAADKAAVDKAAIDKAAADKVAADKTAIKTTLNEMNSQILDVKDKLKNLTIEVLEGKPSAVRKLEIVKERQELSKLYNDLVDKKVAFVKVHFAENPVYALAVPQTLKKGTIYCTAGTQERINKLKEKGMSFDSSVAPTGYDPVAIPSQWGISEMGDRGYYFSENIASYMSEDKYPIAIKSRLLKEISGISLMPVSELTKHGFSGEQINKAFDQLQKENIFLQHDGLYPASTEVVFMRNENYLEVYEDLKFDNSGSVVAFPVTGELHSSWKPKT